MRRGFVSTVLLVAFSLAACSVTADPVTVMPTIEAALATPTASGSDSTPQSPIATPTTETATATPTTDAAQPFDLSRIPIGDGKVSTSAQAGYVWSCTQRFGGGGAFQDGPWINSDGTWNSNAKVAVDGSVTRSSQLSIALEGDQRIITSNDLPDHPTGTFPVASSDEAYQYDRNPNTIQSQQLRYVLPAVPEVAAQPSCVSMGAIGILLSGSVFFNGLDARGDDAVAHEVQDACDGHPEMQGAYHYHSLTPCLADLESTEAVVKRGENCTPVTWMTATGIPMRWFGTEAPR
jgi:hypothetical protein